jgi:hypothetical protein
VVAAAASGAVCVHDIGEGAPLMQFLVRNVRQECIVCCWGDDWCHGSSQQDGAYSVSPSRYLLAFGSDRIMRHIAYDDPLHPAPPPPARSPTAAEFPALLSPQASAASPAFSPSKSVPPSNGSRQVDTATAASTSAFTFLPAAADAHSATGSGSMTASSASTVTASPLKTGSGSGAGSRSASSSSSSTSSSKPGWRTVQGISAKLELSARAQLTTEVECKERLVRMCVDVRRRLLLAGTYGGDLLAYALPIAKSTAGGGGGANGGNGNGGLVSGTGAGAGTGAGGAGAGAGGASVSVGLNALARFPLHCGPIAAMRFAPLIDRLYSAGRDGVVMVTQVHLNSGTLSASSSSSSSSSASASSSSALSSTALVVAAAGTTSTAGPTHAIEPFSAHSRRFGGDADICLVHIRDIERVETRVLQLERAAALGRGENEEALQMLRLCVCGWSSVSVCGLHYNGSSCIQNSDTR